MLDNIDSVTLVPSPPTFTRRDKYSQSWCSYITKVTISACNERGKTRAEISSRAWSLLDRDSTKAKYYSIKIQADGICCLVNRVIEVDWWNERVIRSARKSYRATARWLLHPSMWHWAVCAALSRHESKKSLQRMANIGRSITDCSRVLVKSKFAREQTEDSAGAEGARISRLTSRIGVEWSDNGREIDTRERGSMRANEPCRRILCNRPRASNYLIRSVNEQKRRSQISIGLIRAVVSKKEKKKKNETVKLIFIRLLISAGTVGNLTDFVQIVQTSRNVRTMFSTFAVWCLDLVDFWTLIWKCKDK